VLEQTLNVANLESGSLAPYDPGKRHQPGIGKHIFIDELIPLPKPAGYALAESIGLTRGAKTDLAVVEKDSARRLKMPRANSRILSVNLPGASRAISPPLAFSCETSTE
jgi:hypothetical protein